MNQYQDFEQKYYADRRQSNCTKWDQALKNSPYDDLLPMWIADMDFKTADAIVENLQKRMEHGVFGYSYIPEDYHDALIDYNYRHHRVKYEKEWIRFSIGAIDGLFHILHSLTNEKDGVLIFPPVYPPFKASTLKSKRKVYESELIYKDNTFTFNYKDIEKKCASGKIKAMILCSPHNPLGKVWRKEELEALFKIAHQYHVIVISDEVHQDILMPGYKHIPSLAFKKYQNDIITLTAVSKTFNLAVFSHSHVIIPNKKWRKKFDDYQLMIHAGTPKAINASATYYGYKYGDEWLENINGVIAQNFNYFKNELKDHLEFTELEGTYLLFANFEKYCGTQSGQEYLLHECHVYTNAGETFNVKYRTWARINLATSFDNTKELVARIKKAIHA